MRAYPNRVQPLFGLWVRQLVADSVAFAEPKVVSPAPWCPPLPGLPEDLTIFRGIERRSDDDGVEVLHPRFVIAPGLTFASVEAASYLATAMRVVPRLRRRFPFDLVHAHFTYPDGVVAVALGRRYGVPVLITEQAPWGEWLATHPLVRRQAVWAARNATFQIAISTAVQRSIERFTGSLEHLRVVPDAVDHSQFTLPSNGTKKIPNRVLFVGVIRPVKGVDVLLRAMRLLTDRGLDLELVLIGEGHFRKYREEQDRLERWSGELGLADRVHFVGRKPLPELVRAMQESALLVLPSHAESLGMVLVEALACGTPVVATRCGGPEDIVDDGVGVLVPPDDPEALANGMTSVLSDPGRFDPQALRAHALSRFGADVVSARMAELYRGALGSAK